jgi:hypothetical protein
MTVNPAQARNEAHFQPDFLNGSGTKSVFATGFFLLFMKKNLFTTGFRVLPAGGTCFMTSIPSLPAFFLRIFSDITKQKPNFPAPNSEIAIIFPHYFPAFAQ